ncbi:3'-5' exoribonuclease [Desulfitispora alkaliphila]|uniref:3'-5' exoribonuclease YhaM family protein n=1 Tax=Desulfitispora alkaliphila TaxID=622674 RepID=UPI003D1FE100
MKIKNFSDGVKVEAFYVVKRSEVKKASNGNPYLEIQLSDGIDVVKGRRFDYSDKAIEPNSVVKVLGKYDQKFNSVQIYSLNMAEKGEYPADLFLPKCPKDVGSMWEDLLNILEQYVDDNELKGLLMLVFEKHGDDFKEAPGALAHHHAYLGGLLEHTIAVADSASKLAITYKSDLSLTVAGAILHDLGKIWEYKWDGLQFEMSDQGALLGHISLGISVISIYAKSTIKDEEKRNKLLHIIGSHHGLVEWGAIKEPMIPEAVIVAAADNLDANMFKIYAAQEDAQPGEVTKWDRTMKRHIWVKEKTKDDYAG